MKISVIILNFNSDQVLIKCLESLDDLFKRSNLSKKSEVILINNEEKPLQFNKKYSFPIKIVENKKNLGFSKGCNIGAKKAEGEYLFFLNPDTQILDGKLSDIFQEFERKPKLGILGVKLIKSKDGQPQPWTCGKKTSILRIFFKNSINKPWNKKRPVFVDWVSGTALFVKKTDFQKLNGFDEKFFMYFEDQDLCLRLREINKKCLFYPNFSVLHKEGGSWKDEKLKKRYYYQSQDHFFRKHNFLLEYKILRLTKSLLNKK